MKSGKSKMRNQRHGTRCQRAVAGKAPSTSCPSCSSCLKNAFRLPGGPRRGMLRRMSDVPVPTIDELLALPAAETYKADARSSVWRVDAPVGSYVLKRYEYAPLRQRLGLWLGLHPGQRERRGVRRLRRAGIARRQCNGGPCGEADTCRPRPTAASACRMPAGRCRRGRPEPPVRRRCVIWRRATAKLLAAGLVHRDLKVGNVLVQGGWPGGADRRRRGATKSVGAAAAGDAVDPVSHAWQGEPIAGGRRPRHRKTLARSLVAHGRGAAAAAPRGGRVRRLRA